MTGKIKTLQEAGTSILTGDIPSAKATINHGYPFQPIPHTKRTYTYRQMMDQFKRDGFIDRYSGDMLVNPGLLKVFSFYMPEEFPYHPHGKISCVSYVNVNTNKVPPCIRDWFTKRNNQSDYMGVETYSGG